MELFPSSFIVMMSASWAREPRWGGTYQQMEEVADIAKPYQKINPDLSILYGLIYADQADVLERQEQYTKAKTYYEKALSYGSYSATCYDLARLYYYDLDKPEQALKMINQAIESWPFRDRNYPLSARIQFELGNYDKSLSDIRTAEQIAISNENISDAREWICSKLVYSGYEKCQKNNADALEDLDMAIQFWNQNEEAYYWRGYCYFNIQQNWQMAVYDFKNAIELKPDYFAAYRGLDYALMHEKAWDTIIANWNRYLAIKPNDAEAYFERSGTYYHKGDMENSTNDLKRACSLGHKQACAKLRQMTQ